MEDDGKAELGSLLEINNLDYRLAPSLSVATNRQLKSYRSARVSYVLGQQVNITASTGAAYVDPKNSYISFDAVLPADIAWDDVSLPANGGWAQMFQSYVIMHSSGVEIDRMAASAGEYCQIKSFYEKDKHYRETTGSLWDHQDAATSPLERSTTTGLTNSSINGIKSVHLRSGADQVCGKKLNALNTRLVHPLNGAHELGHLGPLHDTMSLASLGKRAKIGNNRRVHVVIPLCEIAPVFNTNLLMPSFLIAGLRLELNTYPKEHFLTLHNSENQTWPAPVANTGKGLVQLENVYINLETFQLSDSITRKLSQISASSGLEWPFTAVHTANQTITGNEFSYQITRALSRANNIIVKVRREQAVKATFADSFTSLPMVDPIHKVLRGTADAFDVMHDARVTELEHNDGRIEAFQVQLGAQFIPAAPLQSIRDQLHSTLKTFGGLRRTDTAIGLSLGQYAGEIVPGDYQNLAAAGAPVLGLVPYNDGVPIYGPCVGVVAVPLESSSTLNESGAAISAQRTAVVNIKMASNVSVNRRYDFFVEYTKVCTLFLDSVVVRS